MTNCKRSGLKCKMGIISISKDGAKYEISISRRGATKAQENLPELWRRHVRQV